MKTIILHLFLFPAYLYLELCAWLSKRKKTFVNAMAFVGTVYTVYMIFLFIDKIIENI